MNARLTRWRDIETEARRRIADRIWPPGALIPTETELAEEFGCARATVSRAMRELAESGFVERRRKAGTRVAVAPTRHARISIPLIREEIEATGAIYSYKLISATNAKAPSRIATRMGEVGSRLHVAAVHFADYVPFVLEDRWINLDIAPEAAAEGAFETESANEFLVRSAPFTEGEISMFAEGADVLEASSLGVPKGAPLFIVERVTHSGDDVVTMARLSYAPGRKLRLEI